MHGLSWQDSGHIGLAIAASFAIAGGAAAAAPQIERIADLEVAVWRPVDDGAKHPLILFSHGWSGCKTQSDQLMEAFAGRGMLVMAPDHQDNGCTTGLRLRFPLPPELADPASWDSRRFADRGDDLARLLTAAKSDAEYAPLIDPGRVALVGHSLGGYTVLGLAGGWPGWKLDGIAAVVALAPYAGTFAVAGALKDVETPMLFEAGGSDRASLPDVVQAVYERARAQRCIVVYPGAGHLAWVDVEDIPAELSLLAQPQFQDPIAAAAIAFLEDAFEGRPIGTALEREEPAADCK